MLTSFPAWLDIQSSAITNYSQLYQTQQLVRNRSLLVETVAIWSQLRRLDRLGNRACAHSKTLIIEILLLGRKYSKKVRGQSLALSNLLKSKRSQS
jgi:hypothetical protein